jgi:hypothetical protein
LQRDIARIVICEGACHLIGQQSQTRAKVG